MTSYFSKCQLYEPVKGSFPKYMFAFIIPQQFSELFWAGVFLSLLTDKGRGSQSFWASLSHTATLAAQQEEASFSPLFSYHSPIVPIAL